MEERSKTFSISFNSRELKGQNSPSQAARSHCQRAQRVTTRTGPSATRGCPAARRPPRATGGSAAAPSPASTAVAAATGGRTGSEAGPSRSCRTQRPRGPISSARSGRRCSWTAQRSGSERSGRLHPGDPQGNGLGEGVFVQLPGLAHPARGAPGGCFPGSFPPQQARPFARPSEQQVSLCCAHRCRGSARGEPGSPATRRIQREPALPRGEGTGLGCGRRGAPDAQPGRALPVRDPAARSGSQAPAPLPCAPGTGKGGSQEGIGESEPDVRIFCTETTVF